LHSTAVFLYNRCKILFCSGLFTITVVKPIYISLSPTLSRTLQPPAPAPLTSSIYSARPTTSQTQKKWFLFLIYLGPSIYIHLRERDQKKEVAREVAGRSGKDSGMERQRQLFGAATTAVRSGNLI
jgi:hypothetical protein